MDELDGAPSKLVMTTWHDDDPLNREPIDETVEFLAEHMRCEDWSADEYVVFILGGSDELLDEVCEAVRMVFN